ncbi:MAG TPA: LD-carboxypeptidase, partial [Acidobacteria bacterium]|nr:LD-carboxypeptidase [Acidobacteriota bacterium]
PRALRPGDRLSVIAPASPFERDLFELGLAELRDLSFEPVYEPSVFYKREYVAGDPATRAEAFMRAWSDDSVAGVVAARGGYGSVQLLPYLDAESICCRPKVFVGYSDLTAMLNYLTGRCGMVAFHGPTVVG